MCVSRCLPVSPCVSLCLVSVSLSVSLCLSLSLSLCLPLCLSLCLKVLYGFKNFLPDLPNTIRHSILGCEQCKGVGFPGSGNCLSVVQDGQPTDVFYIPAGRNAGKTLVLRQYVSVQISV